MSTRTKSKKPNLPNNTLRITGIIPLANAILAIRFNDGASGTVDFNRLIKKGGVFKPLANPKFFARVEIAQNGYSVLWPGDVDVAVDSLYENAMKSRRARLAG
jgi:uncharacterized protein DUF2442